jgi:hypothetical protein
MIISLGWSSIKYVGGTEHELHGCISMQRCECSCRLPVAVRHTGYSFAREYEYHMASCLHCCDLTPASCLTVTGINQASIQQLVKPGILITLLVSLPCSGPNTAVPKI